MNPGLYVTLVGLLVLSVAAAWLFGPYGLAAAGVVLVAVGVVVDWERL